MIWEKNLLKNVNTTAMACKLKFNNLDDAACETRKENFYSRVGFGGHVINLEVPTKMDVKQFRLKKFCAYKLLV